MYNESIWRAARRSGTSAACSLAGRPLISTSTATDLSAGNGEGSAAASAVAARQSSALAMPRPHELPVLFTSDMEIRVSVVRFCPWPLGFPFSALRRPTDRLHRLLGHILANLPPHGRADTG